MPFRSYDPTIARWNRIDPVVHFGMSTYNAFDNNPVVWADPSGGNSENEGAGEMEMASDHEIAQQGNDIVINWNATPSNGGSIWFNNDSNNGAGHSWSFSHDEALEMFSPANWVAQGGRSTLPDTFVRHRKGDIGGNALSRFRAARRTMSNIYATKWYDVNYGGDGSGSFMDNFNYFVYQTDKINPIAILWDTASYAATGEDRRGNTMTPVQANLNALSIVPIGRAGSAFNASRTVLGADAITMRNASRMVSEKGVHQLLVHGHYDNFIIDGVVTSPKQVARSLLSAGFRKGTPIRCVSGHTGKFSDGAAYQLSRYLKSPVTAPTDRVQVLKGGGYLIDNNGVWKQF